ncbi:MAG: LamG-like jellyroll fold domain-containing protein [Verrucomicrobiota bacterium]
MGVRSKGSQGRNVWVWLVLSLVLCVGGLSAAAEGEIIAEWKFERETLFEDEVGGLTLAQEPARSDKGNFRSVTGKLPAAGSKGAVVSPGIKGSDLRLRVNAPTRGGNPFRLSGTSWALMGWFQQSGKVTGEEGQVIAATRGYSPVAGRGNGGWQLRLKSEEEGKGTVSVLFGSGGEGEPTFELVAAEPVATGADEWRHVALVWDAQGGATGRGVAQLYLDGKLSGTVEVPESFDLATADRNAFRGLWIGGRATGEDAAGTENWGGRLDEISFRTGVVDEAIIAAAMKAEEEPKVETKPAVAKVDPKPAPPAPAVAPGAEPTEEPKMETPPETAAPVVPPKPKVVVYEMREWKDLRGQALEAAMVKSDKEKRAMRVLLRTADEIEFSLPLERLSEADRAYVEDKNGG